MGSALLTAVLALMAPDAPQTQSPVTIPSERVTGQSSFEIRVINIPAAVWRSKFYADCERLGRQGIATVWTLEQHTLSDLLDVAVDCEEFNLVSLPKITVEDGKSGKVEQTGGRYVVGDLDAIRSVKNGKVEAASFRTIPARVDESFSCTITSKPEPGAVNVDLEIATLWVGNVAKVGMIEKVWKDEDRSYSVAAQMDLPQLVDAKIKGSFKVVETKSLLVGLGSATTTNRIGRPVVMERLAIVTPRRLSSNVGEPLRPTAMVFPNPIPMPSVAHFNRTMPPALPKPVKPSRSLPTTAALPPLPDAALTRTSEIHSVPAPLPSLQSARRMPTTVPSPSVDVEASSVALFLRRDPNVATGSAEPIPFAPARTHEAIQAAQALRRDPNIATAAVEPMPIAPASSLEATKTAQATNRDPGLRAASYTPAVVVPESARGPSGVIRIPFLGIEVEFRVK